jgi:hypothetical protein
MEQVYTDKSRFTANTLKIIAIMAMLTDHVGWNFVPMATPLGIIMHIFGRLTMPIMCFFIAEGFFHTRNKHKYAARLLFFAFISQIPFTYCYTGQLLMRYDSFFSIIGTMNVFFTLFLGLMALWVCKSNLHKAVKVLSVIGLCVLAVPFDWMFFGVLYVLAFGLNRGNFKKQAAWFSVVTVFMIIGLIMLMSSIVQLFQAGVFLSLPLLYLYNGKRGGYRWSKWVFYVFYPLHLLILGFIKFGL